jgi:lysozyme
VNADLLAQQLVDHEGERLFPYDDATGVPVRPGQVLEGNLTIGVGRNISGRGIARTESRYLLQNDMGDVARELDLRLPWWRSLDDVRQRVLADMAFNMGIKGLLTFVSFLAEMQRGNYVVAASDLDVTKYAKQVGRRERHLKAMLQTGADCPYSSIK